MLTNRFTGPLSLAVAQTDTLQHIALSVMRSLPRVPNLIGLTPLMTTVWEIEHSETF